METNHFFSLIERECSGSYAETSLPASRPPLQCTDPRPENRLRAKTPASDCGFFFFYQGSHPGPLSHLSSSALTCERPSPEAPAVSVVGRGMTATVRTSGHKAGSTLMPSVPRQAITRVLPEAQLTAVLRGHRSP